MQQKLEEVLFQITQQSIKVHGAGRTDTGVHAKQMIAHLDSDSLLDEHTVYQLNSLLPKDIVVHSIDRVSDTAHARFDALSRTYIYRIATEKDAFNYDFAYHFFKALNIERMNEACELLLNHKDFQCFSKSNTDVKTYHCDIMYAEWEEVGTELHFKIKADRFLRNMVRAIVGTMIEIGLGKMSIEQLVQVIASKDRGQAGYSVPAHGLYLQQIEYPSTIKNKS